MKRLRPFMTAVLLAVAIQSPTFAGDETDRDFGFQLDRNELIETILERNPSIDAARNAIESMRYRVDVAGALDDPRLSAGIAPLTLDDSSIGSSLELSQKFPWPGRLAARKQKVRASVAMKTARLEEIRIELALKGSMLYDRWYLLHRAIELNDHHRELVEQMKESAESHYVVGNAAQQDPLQAEVRITRLLKERIDLETKVRIVRAAMNALMHASPSAELPPPAESLGLPIVVRTDSIPEDQPEIAMARAAIQEAESELRLAELEKRPDIMAMGQFTSMFMNEDHRLMLGVGFRLPVRRSRIDASIHAARADLQERLSELEAVETEVRFELQQALDELDSSLETLTLYRDLLIPASTDQTEAAQTGFTTGRNSFLAVLDAENNLQEVLLGYHEILSNAWSASARAQALLGQIPFMTKEAHHE